MLFFKGKEDMGVEASLKLLDLTPDATIDDANQAYTYLHRMIDLFYKDNVGGKQGSRKEDMDLLTCAYEKAIAFISERDPHDASMAAVVSQSVDLDDHQDSRDLHFTINFPVEGVRGTGSPGTGTPLPEPNERTVEDAISITTRRLKEAEAALPAAQQAVASATAAAVESSRRHEQAKQARLNAIVAAKSAKSRALLMEVEAQRTLQAALTEAEKARVRIATAKQAASDARAEADQARERASRVAKSEETAAAEVVCAEDRLEKEKARLKALTHALLKERDRMKLFQSATLASPAPLAQDQASSTRHTASARDIDGHTPERHQILADLMAIESSLQSRRQPDRQKGDEPFDGYESDDPSTDRRRHPRLAYPPERRPIFCLEGREIPVVDLSSAGMRLMPDDTAANLRIVRGTISMTGQRPVNVAGRVVRQDEHGLGIKLVTRIGDHVLNQARLALSA